MHGGRKMEKIERERERGEREKIVLLSKLRGRFKVVAYMSSVGTHSTHPLTYFTSLRRTHMCTH